MMTLCAILLIAAASVAAVSAKSFDAALLITHMDQPVNGTWDARISVEELATRITAARAEQTTRDYHESASMQSFESDTVLKEEFGKYDTNKDGLITVEEKFDREYAAHYPPGSEQYVRLTAAQRKSVTTFGRAHEHQVVLDHDRNGDGKLNFREFLRTVVSAPPDESYNETQTQAAAMHIVAQHDTNGDQHIGLRELEHSEAALARLSVSASLYKYPSFLKDFSWEALLPKHTPHGSQKHELR